MSSKDLNVLHEGYILDGTYKIIRKADHGGMSTIYKAWHLKYELFVALKVPENEFREKLASLQRFHRAETIGMSLSHPYIVQVFPHEGNKSFPYMVMEFVDGTSLDKIIQDRKTIPVLQGMRIAAQVCEALTYIHNRNVIHSDIKPDNIIVSKDGVVKIIDFGLAYSEKLRENVWADLFSVGGTPNYMAPEQFMGNIDKRSDIYSLGVMLYEMLTGKLPFRGNGLESIKKAHMESDPIKPSLFNKEISSDMEKIILKALEKQLTSRYISAEHMRGEIEEVIKGKPKKSPRKLIDVLSSFSIWWFILTLFVIALAVLFVFMFRLVHNI